MTDPVQLEALSEAQLLDFADGCAETARRAEVDLLRVAYQWAVVHHAGRLDAVEAARPGRERAKQYGGLGTEPVTEFAAAALGARIGRSPYAAARLIGDAQDLAHRHPALWGRVQALEVRASYARHVVTRTRELSESEAGYVDAGVAESADGRIPWSRFEALVEAKVVAAAPAAAREREEKARQARFAKRCGREGAGMASFLIRADVASIAQIDAVVTAVAAALKTVLPDLCADERRVRAIMLLLAQQVRIDSPARTAVPDAADRAATDHTPPWETTPDTQPATQPATEPAGEQVDGQVDGQVDARVDDQVAAAGAELAGIDLTALLPTVQLFVHLYAGSGCAGSGGAGSGGAGSGGAETEHDPETGAQDPIARVEGHGPVTQTWLRDVLGPTCRFTVTPVIDLAAQAPVDAYEIPDRHRRAVHLITPADVFPHAASLSRSTQIDHTVPYDPTGPPDQSRIGNYGPMTTTHHRIKTHSRWHVQQPYPGIYLWQDPHGALHLVDHTGTRHLRPSPITIDFVAA